MLREGERHGWRRQSGDLLGRRDRNDEDKVTVRANVPRLVLASGGRVKIHHVADNVRDCARRGPRRRCAGGVTAGNVRAFVGDPGVHKDAAAVDRVVARAVNHRRHGARADRGDRCAWGCERGRDRLVAGPLPYCARFVEAAVFEQGKAAGRYLPRVCALVDASAEVCAYDRSFARFRSIGHSVTIPKS